MLGRGSETVTLCAVPVLVLVTVTTLLMVSPALTVPWSASFFFFNDTATTEIYTLSLHDALPILVVTDAELLTVPQVADVVGEVMWTWKDAEGARSTGPKRSKAETTEHHPRQ